MNRGTHGICREIRLRGLWVRCLLRCGIAIGKRDWISEERWWNRAQRFSRALDEVMRRAA